MPSHPQFLLVLMVAIFFSLVVGIFYLLTLEKALKNCAPASRTMKPWKVWLTLIPIFGFIWQFVVVMNIAKSLKNEFARLGIRCPEPTLGQNIGLAQCVCNSCIFIPLLGRVAAIPGFVLWIVYWKRIASYSRVLEEHHAIVPA